MPAGLDGNPDPLVTPARTALLEHLADVVCERKVARQPLLLAIDGIDGSGKSTFADELGTTLGRRGTSIVRSTIDSFHNPRETRMTRGDSSPLGFFLDSHNLGAVQERLLRPFAEGAGQYVTAIFDAPSNKPVVVEPRNVSADDILLFDGIFAQRAELAKYWDLTIFLDAQERVNLRRLGFVLKDLPIEPLDVVDHVLDWNRKIDRYSSGMQYYLDLVSPMESADIVIDNNDLARPRLLQELTE